MTKKLVPGPTITLGAEDYTLPPLPLVKMEEVGEFLRGTDRISEEYIGRLADALLWSLLRNYPEMKRDDVLTNIDMANYKDLLSSFMTVNKLQPVEGAASGEAVAG